MAETDQDDEPGFFQRFRVLIVLGVLLMTGAGAYFAFQPKKETKKKAAATTVSIMPVLPPPPPPPPTPPPTPPPQEQPPPDTPKQEEFQAEEKPEEKPEEAPKQEAPDDPPPLGTNIQGEGADNFGLARGGGNGLIGGTGKGSGGSGSTKFGAYAGQVQSRMLQALQSHKRTRSAALAVKVRIWVDSSGRITKATMEGSSGDPAVDRAITSEVLPGVQLSQAPPADMPMPIVLRVNARRPN